MLILLIGIGLGMVVWLLSQLYLVLWEEHGRHESRRFELPKAY